jgi:membrane protease YdiL (CAAX protease family)
VGPSQTGREILIKPEVVWVLVWVLAVGSLAAGLCLVGAGVLRRLLPPQRYRAVPWRGVEVFFACLAYLLWPSFLYSLVHDTGLLPYLPEAFPELYLPVLALPLQVGSVLWVFWRVSGTLPYQLGLSRYRWRQNALAGVIVWLVLTPVAYGVFYVTALLLRTNEEHPIALLAQGPMSIADRITLVLTTVVAAPVIEEFLVRGVMLFWAARRSWRSEIVMVFTLGLAVATALMPQAETVGANKPWYEACTEPTQDFEGVLQAPEAEAPAGGQEAAYQLVTEREGRQVKRELFTGPRTPVSILQPFANKKVKVTGKLVHRQDDGRERAELWVGGVEVLDRPWLARLAPTLFVLLAFLGYLALPLLLRWGLPDLNAARAVYATALFFGSLHSFAWPSPVPLFVLGLGLGWLAHRTQNLVAPVVAHGLFNAVACVELFLTAAGS